MAERESALEGFKSFILRGNVIDLAVAVVIGAAFSAVVTSVVDGLLTPLISAVFGKTDLTKVGTFTLNNASFSVGLVLNALLRFLIVAAVVYFLVVRPLNTLLARFARGEETAAAPDPQLELLAEIRDLLARGGTSTASAVQAEPTRL